MVAVLYQTRTFTLVQYTRKQYPEDHFSTVYVPGLGAAVKVNPIARFLYKFSNRSLSQTSQESSSAHGIAET